MMSIRALTISLLTLLSTINTVQGHMHLHYPPAFKSSNNPHRTTEADPFLDYPYNCCGRSDPLPCKGYLNLLGTLDGAPVVSWAAGSMQNFSLAGIGNHYGGSCQVGFSVDSGTTFKVATSWEGNCPLRDGGESPEGQTFEFKVPEDTPKGDVVFAWTWINREQEFNMNCASVTITDGDKEPAPDSITLPSSAPVVHQTTLVTSFIAPVSTAAATATPSSSSYNSTDGGKPTQPFKAPYLVNPRNSKAEHVAFNDRPDMLFADVKNECITPHTTAEVKYPHPGPDVVEGDGEYPLEMPGPSEKCGY
jgi:hypothetical protein